MSARCVAYLVDGRLCGKPGAVLDRRLGGMVCWEHTRRAGEDVPLMLEVEAVQRLARRGRYWQAQKRLDALARRCLELRERLLREEGLPSTGEA